MCCFDAIITDFNIKRKGKERKDQEKWLKAVEVIELNELLLILFEVDLKIKGLNES